MSFGDEKYGAGQGRVTYGGYLKVKELVSLQEVQSQPEHHDELLFIIIHQVYELWFKQIVHEVETVILMLGAGDVWEAIRLLRRCIEIQRVLITQIQVLETMTPTDFLVFREHLQPASGFQSYQFREIEFLSGLKDRAFLKNHESDPEVHARLERRLDSPSVRDAFRTLLETRGFAMPDLNNERDNHRQSDSELLEALKTVYLHPRENVDLYMLAETMIEYDENFLLWRDRHVRMAERMIGRKPGTGGSSGAEYLRGTLDQKFFPELWDVRTDLTLGQLPDAPPRCPLS